jgi:hypothetical protein
MPGNHSEPRDTCPSSAPNARQGLQVHIAAPVRYPVKDIRSRDWNPKRKKREQKKGGYCTSICSATHRGANVDKQKHCNPGSRRWAYDRGANRVTDQTQFPRPGSLMPAIPVLGISMLLGARWRTGGSILAPGLTGVNSIKWSVNGIADVMSTSGWIYRRAWVLIHLCGFLSFENCV